MPWQKAARTGMRNITLIASGPFSSLSSSDLALPSVLVPKTSMTSVNEFIISSAYNSNTVIANAAPQIGSSGGMRKPRQIRSKIDFDPKAVEAESKAGYRAGGYESPKCIRNSAI
ncbi:MAG: hypothetical protein QM775_07410 [Pirellulales bacterium]